MADARRRARGRGKSDSIDALAVARAALPETSRSAQLVAGVLGERAQVLGALALVVSEADRGLPTRLALAG